MRTDLLPNLVKLIDVICSEWTRCLKPPLGDGSFSPENGSTKCNLFVQSVLGRFGYTLMAGMTANQMIDHMEKNPEFWVKISSFEAVNCANQGFLVVAGWKNPRYQLPGHVCIVRPGNPTTSKKWNISIPAIPMVANVGDLKSCRLDRGANWAFNQQPDYYKLKFK